MKFYPRGLNLSVVKETNVVHLWEPLPMGPNMRPKNWNVNTYWHCLDIIWPSSRRYSKWLVISNSCE
jgi:hypothetical protein